MRQYTRIGALAVDVAHTGKLGAGHLGVDACVPVADRTESDNPYVLHGPIVLSQK